jgi:serine/threonine-protein kinase
LRNRDIRQFLESARRFESQEEYTLALQKVQDALRLDAVNAEAIDLATVIQAKRSSQQIGNWLNLAQTHLSNCAFDQAREAVASVLHLNPTDVTALRLITEINRIEQEVMRKREEKERYYDSAVELRRKGDLTAALSRLQRVLQLDREAPDPLRPERGAEFQMVYNEVRSESESIRNALDESKKRLESKEYAEGRQDLRQLFGEVSQSRAFSSAQVRHWGTSASGFVRLYCRSRSRDRGGAGFRPKSETSGTGAGSISR